MRASQLRQAVEHSPRGLVRPGRRAHADEVEFHQPRAGRRGQEVEAGVAGDDALAHGQALHELLKRVTDESAGIAAAREGGQRRGADPPGREPESGMLGAGDHQGLDRHVAEVVGRTEHPLHEGRAKRVAVECGDDRLMGGGDRMRHQRSSPRLGSCPGPGRSDSTGTMPPPVQRLTLPPESEKRLK